MRVMLLTLLFITTALAGCAGGNDADGDVAADSGDAALDDGLVEDAGPPILYDVDVLDTWGDDETQRVLFDGTVEIQGGCSPGPVANGEVWYGCTNAYLPEGTLVPWGTTNIRVDADASSAQREGTWSPYLIHTRTRSWEYGGWGEGEPTDEDSGTWHFPVEQQDWDLPDQSESETWVHIMGHGGDAHYMQGSVAVTITAERDPGWTPEPIYDPWQDPEGPASLTEGYLGLLDDNFTWTHSASWSAGPSFGDPYWYTFSLKSPIPLDTDAVAIALAWSQDGCLDIEGCTLEYALRGPSTYSWVVGGESEEADGVLYHVFEPGEFAPDPPGSTESAWSLEFWLVACDPVTPPVAQFWFGGCASPNHDVDVEVRMRVEAWRDDVDIAGFLDRLQGSV